MKKKKTRNISLLLVGLNIGCVDLSEVSLLKKESQKKPEGEYRENNKLKKKEKEVKQEGYTLLIEEIEKKSPWRHIKKIINKHPELLYGWIKEGTYEGFNIIHLAAYKGRVDIIKGVSQGMVSKKKKEIERELLKWNENRVKINDKVKKGAYKGFNAMHLGAIKDNIDVVRNVLLLGGMLELEAIVDIENEKYGGKTAKELAHDMGNNGVGLALEHASLMKSLKHNNTL